MLTLQRYILRESLTASVTSLAVLLGVISALFLAELLGDAAQGQLPGGLVVLVLLLRLPDAMMMVGPLALLTGLLMALGRLHEQSEMSVIRSAGFGFARCFAPVLLLAAVWSAGLLLIAGWLTPFALDRSSQIMTEAARQAVLAGLQPGQFQRFDHGRLTVYVGGVDDRDGGLLDLFIQHADPDQPELITAASGRLWVDPQDGSRYLSLLDGRQVRHGLDPQAGPLREMEFARNDIRLPRLDDATLMSGEITAFLPALLIPESPAERRELQWRLAPALASLVLAVLAVPLAYRAPRQGRWTSLIIALALYLVYSNAIQAGLVLMEQRSAMAGPGLWLVHGVLFLIALGLWQQRGRQW
ncbi:MAG: LPS export ABC transporter permease LptF [Wenzhouxiangella sp.]